MNARNVDRTLGGIRGGTQVDLGKIVHSMLLKQTNQSLPL